MKKDKLEQRLTKSAYAYLDRYGSSIENLKFVLKRKARRLIDKEDLEELDVDGVVNRIADKCISLGIIDDAQYAQSKVAGLRRKGQSMRKIQAVLRAKGVPEAVAENAMQSDETDEVSAARRYAQRRRLGAWRSNPSKRAERRDKDIAALCRAGFAVSIAIKTIDSNADDKTD